MGPSWMQPYPEPARRNPSLEESWRAAKTALQEAARLLPRTEPEKEKSGKDSRHLFYRALDLVHPERKPSAMRLLTDMGIIPEGVAPEKIYEDSLHEHLKLSNRERIPLYLPLIAGPQSGLVDGADQAEQGLPAMPGQEPIGGSAAYASEPITAAQTLQGIKVRPVQLGPGTDSILSNPLLATQRLVQTGQSVWSTYAPALYIEKNIEPGLSKFVQNLNSGLRVYLGSDRFVYYDKTESFKKLAPDGYRFGNEIDSTTQTVFTQKGFKLFPIPVGFPNAIQAVKKLQNRLNTFIVSLINSGATVSWQARAQEMDTSSGKLRVLILSPVFRFGNQEFVVSDPATQLTVQLFLLKEEALGLARKLGVQARTAQGAEKDLGAIGAAIAQKLSAAKFAPYIVHETE